MGARVRGMIARLRSIRGGRAAAAVLVSVLTLALVGGVILTTTTVGCGPAQKLGLRGTLSRCNLSDSLTGAVSSPSAMGSFGPTARSTTPPAPRISPDLTTTPAPSAPPVSTTPDSGQASYAYPPFTPPASGAGGTPLAMNCRLPVYVGPAGSGGFIVFPGGSFIGDPKSGVTLPSPSPGASSPAPGYGAGYSGLSYDRAYARWLPVPYTLVSPDGSRYAHTSPDSVYVENVATDTTTELGQGHAWTIIGVQNNGVYATIVNQAGLWLLPYSAAAQQITTTGYWQMASSDAAYGGTTSAVPQGIANTIIRLDLKSGTVSDWFTRGGAMSTPFGLDAHGNALINVSYFVSGGGSEMWITTGPKDRFPLFDWFHVQLTASGTPIADSHGIWFPAVVNSYPSPAQGILLYAPGSGLYWMSNAGTQLAGPCI